MPHFILQGGLTLRHSARLYRGTVWTVLELLVAVTCVDGRVVEFAPEPAVFDPLEVGEQVR